MDVRPRIGRPPADVGPLLLAPLLAPTAGWTSRSIAELTGRSQAAVARAWTRTYTDGATDLRDRIPAAGLRLVAAAVDGGNSVLVLTQDGPRDQPGSGPFMRSPRRPPWQTLLATDLMAARRQPGDSAAAGILRTVRQRVRTGSPLYVLSRHSLGLPSDDLVTVAIERSNAWQGLLAELVHRCTRSTTTELVAAQHLAMEWARSDRPGFEWTAFEAARSHPAPAPPPSRSASQMLADDVLAALLDRISAGRVSGGDRVTESSLARDVHASRSQVRDALRTLAAVGLLDLDAEPAGLVPTPHTDDVVETYAARRAVGTLVVRRAAHSAPGALEPVDRALQDLLDTGRTGNAQATGEADLRFQDAIARSTGMRRIPRMFCDLTAQLRMFVAVMGLGYTYSIPGMCHDDEALMDCIRAHDEAGAIRIWHRKMDDALTYMTTQLAIANAARPSQRGALARARP